MDYLDDDFKELSIAPTETGTFAISTQSGNSNITSNPHSMISDDNIILEMGQSNCLSQISCHQMSQTG